MITFLSVISLYDKTATDRGFNLLSAQFIPNLPVKVNNYKSGGHRPPLFKTFIFLLLLLLNETTSSGAAKQF